MRSVGFLRHVGFKNISMKKPSCYAWLMNDIFRHPEIYPLQVAPQQSLFPFRLHNKCKPISGLSYICKPISGQTEKKCQLISGRGIIISLKTKCNTTQLLSALVLADLLQQFVWHGQVRRY